MLNVPFLLTFPEGSCEASLSMPRCLESVYLSHDLLQLCFFLIEAGLSGNVL